MNLYLQSNKFNFYSKFYNKLTQHMKVQNGKKKDVVVMLNLSLHLQKITFQIFISFKLDLLQLDYKKIKKFIFFNSKHMYKVLHQLKFHSLNILLMFSLNLIYQSLQLQHVHLHLILFLDFYFLLHQLQHNKLAFLMM